MPTRRPRKLICPPLPHAYTLASLRLLVLSYLADLERGLSELQSPHFETWKSKGEHTMEEAMVWANTALEMLEGIRTEVRSRLPELHLSHLSVESFVKSHLPDMPDTTSLTDLCSHLPDMPDVRLRLPDMSHLPEVRSHLPDLSDVRSKLDDVRSRIQDIDFHQPLSYIPTLSDRLKKLHSHLTSVEVPPGVSSPSLTPGTLISDLLDALLTSEFVIDLLNSSPDVIEGEKEFFEKATLQVAHAFKRSLRGVRLIRYSDLPHAWRNNPFVTHGYRFIPLERWPLILMSIFTLHNETLNIHTHLIPFIFWGVSLLSSFNHETLETPELLFMTFALLCLFCSAVWHTMSGCAHYPSMLFCARVDYVGIGWLICASVGTVVYYGYQCHPVQGHTFLWSCFLTGLAGNIFPFMDWFNQRKYRFYRIGFFLTMAFSSIAPLASLSVLHTAKEVISFVSPVVPSILSYIIGLVFYATHFPERVVPEQLRSQLDNMGLGSHMIWHCFIVLAVNQHKAAISALKPGLECKVV
ncbi:hypothetical protein APHAL10511_000174 [Amanita phalloides]|nr:hypothetical protein APHAL10511_000174 [Amanita phalloides]